MKRQAQPPLKIHDFCLKKGMNIIARVQSHSIAAARNIMLSISKEYNDLGETNFSQNVTEPYKGISYPVGDLCRRFTKLTGSSTYK